MHMCIPLCLCVCTHVFIIVHVWRRQLVGVSSVTCNAYTCRCVRTHNLYSSGCPHWSPAHYVAEDAPNSDSPAAIPQGLITQAMLYLSGIFWLCLFFGWMAARRAEALTWGLSRLNNVYLSCVRCKHFTQNVYILHFYRIGNTLVFL